MIVARKISAENLAAAHRNLDVLAFGRGQGAHQYGSEFERTVIGNLGEILVAEYLGIEANRQTFEYDLVYRGHRLEVKSISCSSMPLPHYLCTVNSVRLDGVRKQEADVYVFVRVEKAYRMAWLLGAIPCDEFWRQGKFVPKGSTIDGGVKFTKANATVMPISRLNQMPWLVGLPARESHQGRPWTPQASAGSKMQGA